jgi:hypothetical protein
MWLGAFPETSGIPLGEVLSTILVAAAMIVSVVAFTKAVGPQYELKGSRAGLLLAVASFLTYLFATSIESDGLHVLSIAGFYLGCVLYLGGPKSLISILPSGLILASLFAPMAFGIWGLVYLDGLSWALIVTSVVLIWDSRKGPAPLACAFCGLFGEKRETFCGSCGRQIGPLAVPSRRLLGYLVFTVAMLTLLTLTVPLMTATPTVSLISFGLGGPQIGNHVAPLSGWTVKALRPPGNISSVNAYLLTEGKVSIEVTLSSSQSPQDAATAVNRTMVNSSPYSKLPPSIAQTMSGYTFKQKGVDYVGLLGTFQVSMLNGSSYISSYVGVVLSQTKNSFAADNGSALYSAASEFMSWTTASTQWSVLINAVLPYYQVFSQLAYTSSFAGFGVVLFTIARDDENAKIRRLESMHALGESERAVLDGFGPGRKLMTGEQLRDRVMGVYPSVPISNFYSSLDEVARRGLVAPAVIIQDGRPKLLWKCLVS